MADPSDMRAWLCLRTLSKPRHVKASKGWSQPELDAAALLILIVFVWTTLVPSVDRDSRT